MNENEQVILFCVLVMWDEPNPITHLNDKMNKMKKEEERKRRNNIQNNSNQWYYTSHFNCGCYNERRERDKGNI